MDEAEINSCYLSKFSNSNDLFNSNSNFLQKMKEDTNLYGQNYDIVPSLFIDDN